MLECFTFGFFGRSEKKKIEAEMRVLPNTLKKRKTFWVNYCLEIAITTRNYELFGKDC
jgi:hypothetical protein